MRRIAQPIGKRTRAPYVLGQVQGMCVLGRGLGNGVVYLCGRVGARVLRVGHVRSDAALGSRRR